MTEILRLPTIPLCFLHRAVTEQGDTSTRNADLPRMVLPEELLPVPVRPSRTILRDSASDVGADASLTAKQSHVCVIITFDINIMHAHPGNIYNIKSCRHIYISKGK